MTVDRPTLLYLVHRIPFPPNKGDKIRSFHILRALASQYRVFLGAFVDQPEDWAHAQALSEWCEETKLVALPPRRRRIASLSGLLTGEALTIPYYRSREMASWVRQVTSDNDIRHGVVFSGAMAQYLDGVELAHSFIDFCDVDSAKWSQYGALKPWPMSWLYRREGERLGDFERQWCERSGRSSFATDAELKLFLERGRRLEAKAMVVENGVDAEFFAPEKGGAISPFSGEGPHLVFTGAMDYWPNVDAVCWFATQVLPRIRVLRPTAKFTVVGMNPVAAVRELAIDEVVSVTGTVPDVRPYLRHADVVVAPLRVARGIQNKVLEAMSMGRPVITSPACASGLRARIGEELEVAADEAEYVAAVERCLETERGDAIGRAGRDRIIADYAWDARLSPLLSSLGTLETPAAALKVSA